jgi:hypothetical protein
VLLPGLVAIAAFAAHGRWLGISVVTLGGLVLLSHGFNNIPVPAGAYRIPAVDLLIPLTAVMAYRHWRPVFSQSSNRVLVVAAAVLGVAVAARLAVDVPRWGVLAVRDALFAVELLSLFVGVAVVRCLGHERTERGVERLLVLAIAWFSLFPLRDQIAQLGPQVGIQKAVPLLAMTSAGFVAAAAVLWFLGERSGRSAFLALCGVVITLLYQARGLYLGFPLSLAIAVWVQRSAGRADTGATRADLLVKAGVVVAAGVAAIGLMPALQGRLGPARPSFLVDQLGTLVGRPGPGAGSLEAREDWWPRVLERVRGSPSALLFGTGLGSDLTGGFRGADGSLVRKPHNDFLEVFARLGLVGFGAWILMIGAGVVNLARAARTGCRLARWAIATQPLLLMVALTQPFFGFAYGGAVYWAVVGLGLGCPCNAAADRTRSGCQVALSGGTWVRG